MARSGNRADDERAGDGPDIEVDRVPADAISSEASQNPVPSSTFKTLWSVASSHSDGFQAACSPRPPMRWRLWHG
jgi:hypothetical protein